MAVTHLAVVAGETLVYLDAREEYLKADQARALAIRLLEAAQRSEKVEGATEWP